MSVRKKKGNCSTFFFVSRLSPFRQQPVIRSPQLSSSVDFQLCLPPTLAGEGSDFELVELLKRMPTNNKMREQVVTICNCPQRSGPSSVAPPPLPLTVSGNLPPWQNTSACPIRLAGQNGIVCVVPADDFEQPRPVASANPLPRVLSPAAGGIHALGILLLLWRRSSHISSAGFQHGKSKSGRPSRK